MIPEKRQIILLKTRFHAQKQEFLCTVRAASSSTSTSFLCSLTGQKDPLTRKRAEIKALFWCRSNTHHTGTACWCGRCRSDSSFWPCQRPCPDRSWRQWCSCRFWRRQCLMRRTRVVRPEHTHTHTLQPCMYLHAYFSYCMTELKSYGVPTLFVFLILKLPSVPAQGQKNVKMC